MSEFFAPPPVLKTALSRLEQAVDRLEQALTQATAPDLFCSVPVNRPLDQAARTVEARLDLLSDRLKTLLEEP